MKKIELRKIYLDKRLQLSSSEYATLNTQILTQFMNIDWSVYKVIHLFLPIVKFREIDTFSLINYLNQHYPHLQIVVPKINFNTGAIDSVLFDGHLKNNKYDIPEPVENRLIKKEDIDAVLVPLLIFDKNGNRVGYGKGFYDRFLAQCHSDTQKIGLSFFDPIDAIVDMNDWDIQLNWCICPHKIWRFNIH